MEILLPALAAIGALVGAILLAAIPELAKVVVDPIRAYLEERRTIKPANWDDVRSWGWSDKKLLQRLIELDHDMVGKQMEKESGEKLNDIREGTVEQWAPVFSAHPATWILLTSGPRSIIGYFHFVALKGEAFSKAVVGQLHDGEIRNEILEDIDLPGSYKMYVTLLGVKDEHKGARSKVIDAFFDQLLLLAERGVFFEEICTNAVTPQGNDFCRRIGMEFKITHADFGHVYWLATAPWPRSLSFPRYASLRELYEKSVNP